MAAYIDRMEFESNQLESKLEKLIDFINDEDDFESLDDTEKFLMLEQVDAMDKYSSVLHARIEHARLKEELI